MTRFTRSAVAVVTDVMCGIAGIYAYHSNANPVAEELIRIRDYMAPRGPDGYGEWHSHDEHVVFGHRRLSINRLQRRRGAADGQRCMIVTFNGEIYNYGEPPRGPDGEWTSDDRRTCMR